MKRFGIIFGLIFTITSTLAMIVLLVMAIIHENGYEPIDSIVFIEAINNESVKEGMGFVYKIKDDKNYIVTNYHVVGSSNSLYVENSVNEKISAKMIWYDIYTDIAVLQINNELNLKEAIVSSDKTNVSDEIYYYNIKAISADIENGNSGGPIFNNESELIGMICLKEEESTNAYYLTHEYLVDIVTKLENQTLFRANLGATFVNTTNVDVLNQYGIFVGDLVGVVMLDLKDGFPLQASGLVHGDIITKINDFQITNVNELQKYIYSFDLNETVSIEYLREGIYNRVDVILK